VLLRQEDGFIETKPYFHRNDK
jgi:hypothetical protein